MDIPLSSRKLQMVKKKEDHCLACDSGDRTRYFYRKYFPWDNSRRVFNRNEFKEWFKFYLAQFLNINRLRGIGFLEKFRKHITAQTLFTSKCMIVKCKSCGYGRYERQLTPESLYDYYSTLYFGLESRVELNIVNSITDERAVGQFNFVKRDLLNITPKNLLEIGAADSFATMLIRQHYKNVRIDVVEPMEEFNEYYQKNSINKVADFFPFTPSRIYDYIHTSHWLEHVSDIETSLNLLRQMLIGTGLIFIEVPNCCEEYWSEKMKDDHGHIHYFTEKSLIAFFQSSGFELVKIGTFGLNHPELNKYWVSPDLLDVKTLEKGSKSIINNIPTHNGAYIRALFRKVS